VGPVGRGREEAQGSGPTACPDHANSASSRCFASHTSSFGSAVASLGRLPNITIAQHSLRFDALMWNATLRGQHQQGAIEWDRLVVRTTPTRPVLDVSPPTPRVSDPPSPPSVACPTECPTFTPLRRLDVERDPARTTPTRRDRVGPVGRGRAPTRPVLDVSPPTPRVSDPPSPPSVACPTESRP
jgi:hypothetical protein